MGDGFGVEPEVLRQAASKIFDTVGGADGRKLDSFCGDSGAYGHDALFKAFEEFCSATQLGAEVLVRKAESTGDGLNHAARTYAESDGVANDEMTALVNDLNGSRAPGGK
ncbi:hypothetical protein FHX42_000090 [Saccharopolyspora lacisalsi]|uniref:ESX-1 secretion-associated protein n=1 Tax=Halosaccharopolyspora lacisalsi TaxID=1000566 RepID=A0A839DUE0_9PSEU|nr:hypothetical protein [Halosaccharopolyspora lacisalsi]MBA8822761.1 hypothetical protein [Halosaccharopolyspora lacisalsi]